MLQVMTSEIHVDFTGFPLSVTAPPDCGCNQGEACPDCGVKEIVIDAGKREDGACPQRFVFRARVDDMRRVFREALIYVETQDA